MQTSRDITAQVEEREKDIMSSNRIDEQIEEVMSDHAFIKNCFDHNEKGDALLLAAFLKGRYLYVPPPPIKKREAGLWYKWNGVVWQVDDFEAILLEVDLVAQAYETLADDIETQQIAELKELEAEREEQVKRIQQKYSGDPEKADDKIDALRKKSLPVSKWFKSTITEMTKRASQLRSLRKMNTVVHLAPRMDSSIAITPNLFDQQPMLFPVANGTLDLERGIKVAGKPSDLMTRRSAVVFDEHADYSEWEKILHDICTDESIPGSELIPAFLKRYFGYCLTGYVREESILIMIGPGRNGKGTILETVSEIFGPFFHQVSRALFIEQKFEPPPSAASEHLYALMLKRLCIGSETNKNHRVDDGRVKELTGGNKVNFRRNFGSEEIFTPTHKLVLETNNSLAGLTKSFSLRERLVIIDFPWRYVDDIAMAEKKEPALRGRFKQKNTKLKKHLKEPEFQQKVLKWMLDGCLEWQENGLQIPPVCQEYKARLEKSENHIARFFEEMVVVNTGSRTKFLFSRFYEKVFLPWWKNNMNSNPKMTPQNHAVSKAFKEGGFKDIKVGGNLYFCDIDVCEDAKVENQELASLTQAMKTKDIQNYEKNWGPYE